MNWNNWKLLREHIAAQPPENVRMDKLLVLNRDGETAAEARRPECGTVGCIKGHGIVFFSADDALFRRDYTGVPDFCSSSDTWGNDITEKSLGLDETEDDDGLCDSEYIFSAHWHPIKSWKSGHITRDEVLAYMDKTYAEKNVRVSL